MHWRQPPDGVRGSDLSGCRLGELRWGLSGRVGSVVNLSLGAELPYGSEVLQDAVDYAWGAGAVVDAARGSDGTERSTFYPAAYASALGVVSTKAGDLRSCYSNWGSALVSVSAPGEVIYSTLPLDEGGNDRYGAYSGTSMAAPHVTGLAGPLFTYQPTWTDGEVRDTIEATS